MPACKAAISAVVSGDIGRVVAELQKELKPGNSIRVLGQIQSMHDSYRDSRHRFCCLQPCSFYLLMVVKLSEFRRPVRG